MTEMEQSEPSGDPGSAAFPEAAGPSAMVEAEARRPLALRGESVAPGAAVGPVVLRGFEDAERFPQRIPSDEIQNELNRLREALSETRAQFEEIKERQRSKLKANELRIFDTHSGYLSDPLFVSEIEKLVMNERFSVTTAIRRVVDGYDRIFQLVESDMLRQRAGDFRDVATRVLRNLAARREVAPVVVAGTEKGQRFVLAARKLSTADIFNLDNVTVEGIVTEEGGISSHAAILARSMGIPTVTGIRNLPQVLAEGDVVALDGGSGEVWVHPDEDRLVASTRAAEEWKSARVQVPDEDRAHATRDGATIRLLGSCGNLGEAELARTFGMDGVGLFRTELKFLETGDPPNEDTLTKTYRDVVRMRSGMPVHFRLLDVHATLLPQGAGKRPGRNPAMGLRGVRALLDDGETLRLQLRAILRAAVGRDDVSVLIPFVTGLSEIHRVRSAALEERLALQKAKIPCADRLRFAPIVEVPAAAYVLRAFLADSDFVVVAIDDLQAHLLAADRDDASVRDYYEMVHPALFELVARMAKDAEASKKEIVLFGEAAADPLRLPFYVGVGIRAFSVAPVRLNGVLDVLRRYTVDECRTIATQILEAPRSLDVQRVLVNLSD